MLVTLSGSVGKEKTMLEEHQYANWRSLIKPGRLERGSKSNERYGKFVAKPLERGFGITLGNSLRRVLLSSLQGAAITQIQIDGVLHEFSSVPGVVEDSTDIVLNLKQVVIKTTSLEPITATLSGSGTAGSAHVVRAGDIVFNDVEGEPVDAVVLNPEHPICTITDGGEFSCALTIKMGKGYIPSSMNKGDDSELGIIAVDSIHTPIQKVKYTVTNARVGNRTDYDKLVIELWTNGSVLPEDAIAFSAKIIREQLRVFVHFDEGDEPVEVEEKGAQEEVNEALFRRVDELELSVRSANCLQNAGIEYIYQLVERTEAEMLKTKNFGRKSLNEIKELLGELSLGLGTKLSPNFPRNN
jgi:DNA-directed RNA polymerase subunit alpha